MIHCLQIYKVSICLSQHLRYLHYLLALLMKKLDALLAQNAVQNDIPTNTGKKRGRKPLSDEVKLQRAEEKKKTKKKYLKKE